MNGVLLLGGPTTSGKTELAIELACRFGAEIIGADSRQVYRNMPIGTATPTPAQRSRAPHHLVEFLGPHERYSAARFVAAALEAIDRIAQRGNRAIVVGGTGFYLRALAGDIALSPAYDEALRARLARESCVHPAEVLHAWLTVRDPTRANAISAGDRYRITRALEVALARNGATHGDIPVGDSLRTRGIPALKVFVDIPAPVLVERIAARVDAMLEAGLIDEADRVGPHAVAADAVGYPQAFAFLHGWMTRRELRSALIRATRRYAKRQLTWQRSEPGATYAAPGDVPGIVASSLGW